MDFGFSGLVEKFEEYFGRKATKFLLACVGFLVIATALNLSFKLVINPLISLVAGGGSTVDFFRYVILLAVAAAVTFMAGLLANALFAHVMKQLRLLARVTLLQRNSSRNVTSAQEILDKNVQTLAEIQETMRRTEELSKDWDLLNEKIEQLDVNTGNEEDTRGGE